MYKIATYEGEVIITEKLNYIRMNKNGCYVLCDRHEAEGVAHGGTRYMFADGAMICEFDGGRSIDELTAKNVAINEHLAEADEIAIDLYEAGLAREAVNAEQDEAIIEIYEMMEGNTNG